MRSTARQDERAASTLARHELGSSLLGYLCCIGRSETSERGRRLVQFAFGQELSKQSGRCKQRWSAPVGVAENGNSGCASPVHHGDAVWRLSAASLTETKPHG